MLFLFFNYVDCLLVMIFLMDYGWNLIVVLLLVIVSVGFGNCLCLFFGELVFIEIFGRLSFLLESNVSVWVFSVFGLFGRMILICF